MPKPSEAVRTERAEWADRVRDALLRTTFRLGWRVAAYVPAVTVRLAAAAAARIAMTRQGRHLRLLRRNLALVTGRPADDDLVRTAVGSYLRTFWEVLALPGWSTEEILGRVRTEDEHHLRDAYARSGAVVALPHSGNWDLAGAWACGTGMPVTTVAEQLSDAEFAAFVGFRRHLGMEVLSHREPGVISALAGAVRRGRLVCLMADRDLDGTGLAVQWGGQPVTMPAGPAMVARRTGAALVPACCRYQGETMVIRFGSAVPARPGREGLVAMTQEVADFFAGQLAQHPQDWHMLQPFFAVDREAGR